MNDNKVATRKDEIRYVTSEPKRMLGRFICRNVLKVWQEVFLLENGETTTLERNEILFEKGKYIDQDTLAKIRFFMQAGEIKEVEVSNQNRKGSLLVNNHLQLYKAAANISGKKHIFLLYATSVKSADTILTDYVELNRKGGFYVTKIEEIDNNYVITDNVDIESSRESIDRAYIKDEISSEEYCNAQVDITGTEPDFTKMNFYQITARIIVREGKADLEEQKQTVIVHTYTATRANLLIEAHLRKIEKERYAKSIEKGTPYQEREIASYIEESKTLSIGTFIPMEFSKAYQDD